MYDVVIIGLGVIGCATARELSRFRLNVLGIDAAPDVACGTSKANTASVHSGYDAKPGTLKAKFNLLGNRMFEQWAKEMDFPFWRLGSLTLCMDQSQVDKIRELYDRGIQNGVTDMEILSGEQVKALEPNLTCEVYSALLAKTCGITCPYEATIAFAENAAHNGVQFQFNTKVLKIKRLESGFELLTTQGSIFTKTVLNAAGLFADEMNNMVSNRKLKIIPRKGEYLLMDNKSGQLFHHFIFKLPTPMGKGTAIGYTVSGNLFIGPTAYDIESKTDTATTREGLVWVIEQNKEFWNNAPMNRFITAFAGLRAHEAGGDFVLGEAPDVPGFYNAAGIESPGLTAAPAIGEYLAKEISVALGADKNPNFDPHRKGIQKFAQMSADERRTAIAKDPRYGNIVCRCEQVTEAEIVQAIHSYPGATTVDGVKRRTRAGMGKCQGGFCTPLIVDLLARELNIPKTAVKKDGAGSEILSEPIS